MLKLLTARLKAIVALLGVVLFYIQAYQATNPSHELGALIGVLTVIGVHATPNLE